MNFQRMIFCRVLVMILIWCSNFSLSHSKEDSSLEITREVLKSLKKAVGFFGQEYKNVNLDAVFGLRVAEGILLKITEDPQAARGSLDEETFQQIVLEYDKASENANNGASHVRGTTPLYYQKMGFLVSQPWYIIKAFRKLVPSLATPLTKGNFNRQTDHLYKPCMTQLLGNASSGAKPCNVSNACWDMMVERGDVGYGLTHKALYFLFGEQRGCLKEFSRHLGRHANWIHSLEDVYDRICSSMFLQMNIMQRIKNKHRVDMDLFMEQGAVCGLLGYHEFLSVKRLRDVIKWQLPSGCYGDVVAREPEQTFSGSRTARRTTMRRTLTMKELSDGCESHITGVATALLGVYLNWLITSPRIPQAPPTQSPLRPEAPPAQSPDCC